ncbi:hypothetical protein ACSBR2_025784 [Camellia fascicularis]
MVGEMSKGLVATQTQNPVAHWQAKFKEFEAGFKAWLAKQSLPVEAAVVTATIAAIGAFMGTLTNDVSSSFPTPLPNAASMNP